MRTPAEIAALWKAEGTFEDIRETVLWLQRDAEFVYAEARNMFASDKLAKAWLAAQFQDAAAHSAAIARILQGIE